MGGTSVVAGFREARRLPKRPSPIEARRGVALASKATLASVLLVEEDLTISVRSDALATRDG